MNFNLTKKCLSLFVLIMIFGLSSFGQRKGVLKGVITDKSTGSSLPGATIIIAGTNQGTITGLEGDYTLTNIPEGSNKIVFSFISYRSDTIDVNIVAGKTQILDMQLTVDNIGLDEVIITAQLLGQKKAISQQLQSDAIVNVVSEDKIKELPDVNAAEAIARLPGIAINRSGGEGTKIVIRGMEPKYAAITINGIRIPSNSSGDRSVDLSLISPEMLSGIEVYKSPLPNMDAEASAGTVNLKLRKAPDKLNVLAKGLVGFNNLNSEFKDYKGVFQVSNRIFDSKLGVLVQGAVERFNRSGDVVGYGWSQGGTNAETGVTAIYGSSLGLTDNQEIRKRLNGSVNLDYDLNNNHSFAFFSILSRTERDRFSSSNSYSPSAPGIGFSAAGSESTLDLTTFALSGDHTIGKMKVDWSLSTSKSEGDTPYSFGMNYAAVSIGGLFDTDLDRQGHPNTYLDAAHLNTDEIYLAGADLNKGNTFEKNNLAFVNAKIPFQIGDKVNVSFEFGGRYSIIDRSRLGSTLSERFYYLGTDAVQRAAELHNGELIYIPSNDQLLSSKNWEAIDKAGIELEDGSYFEFPVTLDRDKYKDWSNEQHSNFKENRYGIAGNYDVEESVMAGYAMFKISIGDMFTLIPGFRYEHSDNTYLGAISEADGTYGQNGSIKDTVTYQKYGEFFPHLHMKFKPVDWFDIRASYAKTISRPSFGSIKPTAQINHSSLGINSGNPNLKHSLTDNYDVNFSFFRPKIGLFTIGAFYKDIDNVITGRSVVLTNPELAEEYGWPGYSGYRLSTSANIPKSKVWGYETEIQTNLSFLPQPFTGIVLSANYAKLYSETDVIFLTSETVFGGGFPPIPVTTYTENTRTVSMPSQAPSIFRASIGYDYKGFSARVSTSYQGTKASGYSLNKDFDRYNLEFWRWDASAKQNIGEKWSLFLNLNNIFNQQDISFMRDEGYVTNIQTYGFTGTLGAQFKF
jgi:TonB-dependent receptor